jgi:hypothetical protein
VSCIVGHDPTISYFLPFSSCFSSLLALFFRLSLSLSLSLFLPTPYVISFPLFAFRSCMPSLLFFFFLLLPVLSSFFPSPLSSMILLISHNKQLPGSRRGKTPTI